MSGEIWIIGYYDRKNLGDDVFGWVFQNQLFSGNHVRLINSDNIPTIDGT